MNCILVFKYSISSHQKGYTDGKLAYEELVQHYMSLGNFKLRHWDTPTYLLEWLECKALTTPNAVKDVEEQEFSLTAGGNTKWYSHFGKQFGGFLQNKTNAYHFMQPSYSLLFTQMS